MKLLLLFPFVLLSTFLFAQVDVVLNFTNLEDDVEVYINETHSGDFNGDGTLDFIFLSHQDEIIFKYLSTGASSYSIEPLQLKQDTRQLAVFDFDNDGDLDMLGSAAFDSKSIWLENDGVGNFVESDLNIEDYNAVHFADINNDGANEMILGTANSLDIYNLNNGLLSFEQNLLNAPFGLTFGDIKTDDINGDGLLDVITLDNSHGVTVLYNSSSGDYVDEEIEPTSFSNNNLHISDINSDGIKDFLMHSQFSGRTTVLKSNTSGAYDKIELPKEDGRNEFSAFGDLDNDGDVDIFYIEEEDTNDGTMSVMINEDGEFTRQVLSKDFSWTDSGGIADLDGDGDLDIYAFTNYFFDAGFITFENVTEIDPSSIHELGELKVSIYPNPAHDNLYLESKDASLLQLRLIDMNGRVIVKETNVQQIGLSQIESGSYILELTNTKSGFVSQEIIIVK